MNTAEKSFDKTLTLIHTLIIITLGGIMRRILGGLLILIMSTVCFAFEYNVGPANWPDQNIHMDYNSFGDCIDSLEAGYFYDIMVYPNLDVHGSIIPYIESSLATTDVSMSLHAAEGYGADDVIIQLNGSNAVSFMTVGGSSGSITFSAEDITFQIPAGHNESVRILFLNRVNMASLTECHFHALGANNVNRGVHYQGHGAERTLDIEDCVFSHAARKTSEGAAIFVEDAADVTIESTLIENNNKGICCAKCLNHTFTDCVIRDNNLATIKPFGISMVGYSENQVAYIDDCEITNNANGIWSEVDWAEVDGCILSQVPYNILIDNAESGEDRFYLECTNSLLISDATDYTGPAATFLNNGTLKFECNTIIGIEGLSTNFDLFHVSDNNLSGLMYSIVNNIIQGFPDLQCLYLFGPEMQVQYCCCDIAVPPLYAVDSLNIVGDPLFVDPGNTSRPNWGYGLSWPYDVHYTPSPCIDAGDPASPYDPDGTRKDIGAFPYWQVERTYRFPDLGEHNRIAWTSFPIVNPTYNEANNRYMNEIREMLDVYVEPQPTGDPLLAELFWDEAGRYGHLKYTGTWSGLDHQIQHVYGYKLKFTETEVGEIVCKGRMFDTQNDAIPIARPTNPNVTRSNLVGYFVKNTQGVFDAFSRTIPSDPSHTYLDYIYDITTQDWSVNRRQQSPGSPWIEWSTRPLTLENGDAVHIKVFYGAPEKMLWNLGTETFDSWEAESTSYFDYTETFDYTPVYIRTDAANPPVELAVYVEGACIGAAVVEDTLTQVRAYLPQLERGEDGGMSILAYYGGRGDVEQTDEYRVYKPQDDTYETRRIDIGEGADYYMVSLVEPGADSPAWTTGIENVWPNPFNPEATVRFSLAQEGNAELRIYNVRGQLVKTLVNSNLSAGTHDIVWDGRDSNNIPAASGVYMLQLRAGGKTSTRKALLLK